MEEVLNYICKDTQPCFPWDCLALTQLHQVHLYQRRTDTQDLKNRRKAGVTGKAPGAVAAHSVYLLAYLAVSLQPGCSHSHFLLQLICHLPTITIKVRGLEELRDELGFQSNLWILAHPPGSCVSLLPHLVLFIFLTACPADFGLQHHTGDKNEKKKKKFFLEKYKLHKLTSKRKKEPELLSSSGSLPGAILPNKGYSTISGHVSVVITRLRDYWHLVSKSWRCYQPSYNTWDRPYKIG